MIFAQVHLPLPPRQAFTYLVPDGLAVGFGSKVTVPFGRRRLVGYVTALGEQPPDLSVRLKPIEKVLIDQPLFDQTWLDLARWLADWCLCSLGEAIDAMVPGGGAVKSRAVPVDDDELATADYRAPAVRAKAFSVSEAQSAALAAIRNNRSRFLYLLGPTGSGKTEVFLQAAEMTLARGQAAMYLVPEIALTGQVVDEIRRRFPATAAILHSRLTPSQRLGEWRRALAGQARLIVGARSAVFAPVQNLGLIILDEEHETSYKNGSTPRYHARQVAMHRVADQGLLLMGSATPSVEAWELMRTGRIKRLDLPQRVSGGAMPKVVVVPMAGVQGAISRQLAQEIRQTKNLGAQTILFLNRRGFAYFFYCRTCGFELTCSHCSAPLTYHRQRQRMICHHCGRSQAPPTLCPACHGPDCGFAGFGTEFVENEVRQLFPDLEIARLDTDTIRRKGQLTDTLNAFRRGQIDLLLGTQMVAKGLNVPGLRLAGVILADGGLHLPDFRAAERTFNLLVQVSGRAGRFRDDGIVVMQAMQADHPVIKQAAGLDMTGFYERELTARKHLGFPPFCRLFRLVFRAAKVKAAQTAAANFLDLHRSRLAPVAEILGPAECPLGQVNGNWRFHILLMTKQFGPTHRVLAEATAQDSLPGGVYLEIDVDPINMF